MRHAHKKPWWRQTPWPPEGGGAHRRAWYRRHADIACLRRLLEAGVASGYALRHSEMTLARLRELEAALSWLRNLEHGLYCGPVRHVEVRSR